MVDEALFGVAVGDDGDGPVETVLAAEVGGDRHRVARARVRPGKDAAAQRGVARSMRGPIEVTSAEPFSSRSCRQ